MSDTIPVDMGIEGDDCLIVSSGNREEGRIILEDLVVTPSEAKNDDIVVKLRSLFGKVAPAADRIVLVSDKNFSFLGEHRHRGATSDRHRYGNRHHQGTVP